MLDERKYELAHTDMMALLDDISFVAELEVDPINLTFTQYKYIMERLRDVKDELYLSLERNQEDKE